MIQRSTAFIFTCLASFSVVLAHDGLRPLPAYSLSPSLFLEGGSAPDPVQVGEFTIAQASQQSAPTDTSADALDAFNNPVLLAPGAQGEEVRVLQQQLSTLGYYQGAIDGVYGPATQASVQQFQEDSSLPPTGRLDRSTWEQMRTPQLFPRSAEAAPSASTDPSPSDVPPATAQSTPPSEVPPSSSAGPASEESGAAETPLLEGLSADPTAAGESQGEDAPADSPDQADDPDRRGPRLWLLGIGGLALLGLGGTFLFALFRRPSQDSEEDSELGDDGFESLPGLSTPGGAPRVHQNGSTLQSSAVPQPPNVASEVTLASGVESTTRLARVNIVDELVGELSSPDPGQRRKAIWELGQRGNSTAIQPLVDAMLDADSKERSLILAALSEIGMRSLTPMNRALALSLQDQNPEVRKNAIRDLTRIYDLVAQLSQMLAHAAQDSNPDVQATARWAIEQLGRIRQLSSLDPPSPMTGAQPPTDWLPQDSTANHPQESSPFYPSDRP